MFWMSEIQPKSDEVYPASGEDLSAAKQLDPLDNIN